MADPVLSDVLFLAGAYRRASFPHRLHTIIRRFTCPFHRIVEALPANGSHVDVGCGHGVLLALLNRRHHSGRLLGIDIDQRKIHQAMRCGLKGIDYACEGIRDLQPFSFDSMSVVDVLYLLPDEEKAAFLKDCAGALKPGGTLVVKALVNAPGWKYRMILIQEYIMVKILGVTRGDTVRITSPEALAGFMRGAGFSDPRVTRLDRGFPYPHSLFVCTTPKPGGPVGIEP